MKAPGLGAFALRVDVEQHRHQVNTGHAVYHAVVHLAYDGKASVIHALDHPHLPQRPAAVEVAFHYATGETLELLVSTGPGQRSVTNVVVDVEVRIVYPNPAITTGHLNYLLPVARDERQGSPHRVAHRIDVDAAVGMGQLTGLEDHRAADVHRYVGLFEDQEGIIERAQALKEHF